MWPVVWWYLSHVWPVVVLFIAVAALFGVATWTQRRHEVPNCFICDRPGTVRLYATVAVCEDHANGRGGDSPLVSQADSSST